MRNLRAALYCSVEYAKNIDDVQSEIFKQKEQLGIYATMHLVSLESDYEDWGYEQDNYDRPAFQQLMLAALHGEFDAILTWKAESFLRCAVSERSCTMPLRICSVAEKCEWIIEGSAVFLPHRITETIIAPSLSNVALYYPQNR